MNNKKTIIQVKKAPLITYRVPVTMLISLHGLAYLYNNLVKLVPSLYHFTGKEKASQ